MAVRVRAITLWRVETDNKPGTLAQTLQPLAAAGADLQVVMGYRLPGDHARAAIEIFPVTGARALAAAQAVGLSEAEINALHVEGDNRVGVGHAIAKALADAGMNIDFFLAQVSGPRYTTVIGFGGREDADRAIPLIKRVAAAPRQPITRKTVKRRAAAGTTRARKARRRR